MQDAIVAEDLVKYYGDKPALQGLSFQVEAGTITATLGPNGAGKTTCLRILATTLLPSGGSVRVLGHEVVSEARQIRRCIAVVPQEALTDPDLTAWESVYGYLRARGCPRREAATRATESLHNLGLWDVRYRVPAGYSGGMKRRTIIAMARERGVGLSIEPAGLEDAYLELVQGPTAASTAAEG